MSARRWLFLDLVIVAIVLVSLFSSFVGFQSPHLGKLLGTGGSSVSSPTLKINDIPISAWNSMWQWNNQYPKKISIIYRFTLMSRFFYFFFPLFIWMRLCLTWIIGVKSYNGITTVGHGYRILQRCPFEFSMYQTLPIQFPHFIDGSITSYSLHSHYAELIAMKVKRMIRIIRNTCQRSLATVKLKRSLNI